MLARHPQRLHGYFLEVAFLCEHQSARIIGNLHDKLFILFVVEVYYLRLSRLSVLLRHILELVYYDELYFSFASQNISQLGYFSLKLLYIRDPLEYKLAVEMPELYLSDILRLSFIYSEAYHEVWNYLRLLVGLANYFYRLVYVKKDLFKTVKKMKPFLLLLKVEAYPPLDAANSEAYPFSYDGVDAEHLWITVYKNVEIR